jgi:O-antigen ligase
MTPLASIALLVIAVPLGLLLVFGASVGTVRLALISAEHRTFGAGVLLVAYLIEAALVTAPSVEVGLNISTNDVAALLMLLALFIGAASRPLPLRRPVFLVWLGFAAIILMNLAIGLDKYGKPAGVEIRPTFGFLVATLYFCVIDFTQEEILRMARWCTVAGYGLAGIALYRWIGLAAGSVPLSSIVEVGAGNEFRALRADGAFFLAMLSLGHFLLWLRGRGSRLAGFHALLFASLVVVLQHRSAWAAYALGILLVLVHQHRHLWRRLPFILTFCLLAGGAMAIAATFGVLDHLAEALVESVVSVGNANSTATDRIDAWDTLLSEWRGADDWDILFGFPFGHGFRWYINHAPVDFQPHNFYVFLLLRTGACGLFLFLIVSTVTCLHALAATTRGETDDLLVRCLGFVMFATLVYYIPYQAISIHGALTGLAIGLLIHRPRVRADGVRRSAIAPGDTASHMG